MRQHRDTRRSLGRRPAQTPAPAPSPAQPAGGLSTRLGLAAPRVCNFSRRKCAISIGVDKSRPELSASILQAFLSHEPGTGVRPTGRDARRDRHFRSIVCFRCPGADPLDQETLVRSGRGSWQRRICRDPRTNDAVRRYVLKRSAAIAMLNTNQLASSRRTALAAKRISHGPQRLLCRIVSP